MREDVRDGRGRVIVGDGPLLLVSRMARPNTPAAPCVCAGGGERAVGT